MRLKSQVNNMMIFLICIVMLSGCAPSEEQEHKMERSFYMALTPFPHAMTMEAVEYANEKISENADAILIHFDRGVPWDEAFKNERYPEKVEREINDRLNASPEDNHVILSVTPLNGDRSDIAGYWRESSNEPISGHFFKKTLDDPDVIKAYIQFCKRLIEDYEPTFFIYGIELNLLNEKSPHLWEALTVLCKETYEGIKKDYPELPVSFSIQLHDYYQHEANDKKALLEIMDYTDYIAVSTYPFDFAGPGGPEKRWPSDYFSNIRALAPTKPFAIAETGFIAEDLILSELTIPSSVAYQDQYMQILLNAAQKEEAKFVNWFIVRDYDDLWEEFKDSELGDVLKYWRDCGLYDGKGNERPALKTWQSWFEKPLSDE